MRGVMSASRSAGALLAVLSLVALSHAGPLGPLPNVTSSDVGVKEGSCVVGDVVYMAGDTFAGSTACERCACAAGAVSCAQERCEPRPGCKALHRPDHCCPTYQCECEQEGRVYGNGEKLVDPQDPCRVCYCQGGEVVCRRIACFLRDDCQPRLVPGRCCPEYDNCPLRGVTAIPGLVPPVSSVASTEDLASSAAPTPPKENIKQEITIKEITPVSEIPVITEVKIKEILPSPSIDVPEYPSSKSPLIPREAVPDKTVTSSAELSPKTEESVVIDLISPLITEQSSKPIDFSSGTKSATDTHPSKISLSTQDSINSDIYPSHIPTIIASMGVPPLTPDNIPAASTTRVAVIEEEDTSLFDHNPAFPPIPDDLSVIGTHDDEIVSEQNSDSEHITNVHGEQHIASTPLSTYSPVPKEVPMTTAQSITETSTTTPTTTTTTEKIIEAVSTLRTTEAPETSTAYVPTSTTIPVSTIVATSSTVYSELSKDSLLPDLRAAIPTDISNLPPLVSEDLSNDFGGSGEPMTASEEPVDIVSSTTSEPVIKIAGATTSQAVLNNKMLPRSSDVTNTPFDTTTRTTQGVSGAPEALTSTHVILDKLTTQAVDATTEFVTSTTKAPEKSTTSSTVTLSEELTTSSSSRPNIATEITSETYSSFSIETSDQNPRDSSESVPKDKSPTTTEAPAIDITTATTSPESREFTVTDSPTSLPPQTSTTNPENRSFENIETTEFILTSFGSSESTTDEIIKISAAQTERNAAMVVLSRGNQNDMIGDLFNLVQDVGSLKHDTSRTTTANVISDSEELMPVNAGYKSKNNNFNLNSITEVPLKIKNQLPISKQKVIEIEGEDTDSITDAAPPHDKAEPTTRRPIIDHVSDTERKNETDKKDIEIISQSYVPTINRRPTKVVMKKNNDKPLSEVTASSEEVTSSDDETTSPVVVTESALSSSEWSPGEGVEGASTPAPTQ